MQGECLEQARRLGEAGEGQLPSPQAPGCHPQGTGNIGLETDAYDFYLKQILLFPNTFNCD